MLPGGLDIVGIFAAGPPDQMKAAQIKLRQVCVSELKSILLVYSIRKWQIEKKYGILLA